MVLGEPGAGKSVALRKLCRELLDEVQASSRLPIYVNLKEWRPGLPWTPATPPDVLQLKNFILANIRRRVPLSARFLGEFFDRLADYGHIFFILDSFDEIPVLLDVDESSWLIRELSAAATDLLAGGSYARGVLASRHYRRPRLTLTRYRQLEVRAFLEEKIAAAIDRATAQSEKVKQAVFVARPDLGAVIRNPFLLGLLLDFVDINPGKLPESIMDLYRSFVAQRLAEGAEQLREHGLRNL